MTSRRRSREADPEENVVEVEIEEDEDADIPSDDENSGTDSLHIVHIISGIGATKFDL